MPYRTELQIALLVVGMIVWGYGQRSQTKLLQYIGLGFFGRGGASAVQEETVRRGRSAARVVLRAARLLRQRGSVPRVPESALAVFGNHATQSARSVAPVGFDRSLRRSGVPSRNRAGDHFVFLH